jgi:hypothetical protein
MHMMLLYALMMHMMARHPSSSAGGVRPRRWQSSRGLTCIGSSLLVSPHPRKRLPAREHAFCVAFFYIDGHASDLNCSWITCQAMEPILILKQNMNSLMLVWHQLHKDSSGASERSFKFSCHAADYSTEFGAYNSLLLSYEMSRSFYLIFML